MKRCIPLLLSFMLMLTLVPVHQASAKGDPKDGPAVIEITKDLVKRAEKRAAAGAEQAAGGCGGTAAWWFDVGAGDNGASDMDMWTNWSFCKINGSTTNFFIDAQGSATGQGKQLIAFEPWIQPRQNLARLRDRNPSGAQDVRSNVTVTFGLSYGGASTSVSYNPTSGRLNPFIDSSGTYYSVQWKGIANSNITVGNGYTSRWSGGDASSGIFVGNCAFLALSTSTYLRGYCPRSSTP